MDLMKIDFDRSAAERFFRDGFGRLRLNARPYENPFVAVSLQPQLPTASPKAPGFDPARLTVLHATTKRFVDKTHRQTPPRRHPPPNSRGISLWQSPNADVLTADKVSVTIPLTHCRAKASRPHLQICRRIPRQYRNLRRKIADAWTFYGLRPGAAARR